MLIIIYLPFLFEGKLQKVGNYSGFILGVS